LDSEATEEEKRRRKKKKEEEVFQNCELPRFAVVSPQLFAGARRPFSLILSPKVKILFRLKTSSLKYGMHVFAKYRFSLNLLVLKHWALEKRVFISRQPENLTFCSLKF
jgi:hypothetical protein